MSEVSLILSTTFAESSWVSKYDQNFPTSFFSSRLFFPSIPCKKVARDSTTKNSSFFWFRHSFYSAKKKGVGKYFNDCIFYVCVLIRTCQKNVISSSDMGGWEIGFYSFLLHPPSVWCRSVLFDFCFYLYFIEAHDGFTCKKSSL